jgi:hypothetical protein
MPQKQGKLVGIPSRARRLGLTFFALAILAGGTAWADPASRSSYVVVQEINPYFLGVLSVVFAVVAGNSCLERAKSRWAVSICGGIGALFLAFAGVVAMPPPPKYSLDGPGNGLVLIVTRDAAFLDPTDVVTIQKPSGLDGREWYLTCFDNFPGFQRASWLSASDVELTYGDGTATDTQEFHLDRRTGQPSSTGTCNFAADAQRPGVRSPR